MKNYTWDEAKYAIPYTDTIICVTDRNNELYIGQNGEWVPVVSQPDEQWTPYTLEKWKYLNK